MTDKGLESYPVLSAILTILSYNIFLCWTKVRLDAAVTYSIAFCWIACELEKKLQQHNTETFLTYSNVRSLISSYSVSNCR